VRLLPHFPSPYTSEPASRHASAISLIIARSGRDVVQALQCWVSCFAIQPEVPLVLPSPIEIFTLGLDGSLASARRSDGTSWSPLTLLPTKDSYSKLRRLRVIITLSFGGGKDTQLFYISQQPASRSSQGGLFGLDRSGSVLRRCKSACFQQYHVQFI
jgi:hypothetical protein